MFISTYLLQAFVVYFVYLVEEWFEFLNTLGDSRISCFCHKVLDMVKKIESGPVSAHSPNASDVSFSMAR